MLEKASMDASFAGFSGFWLVEYPWISGHFYHTDSRVAAPPASLISRENAQ